MKTTSKRSSKSKAMKRIVSGICCLAIIAGIMTAAPAKTKAATVSWNNKSISVSTDNATVKIRANAASKVKWTAASGTIFDTNGKVVARKTEKANYTNKYMNIWYDVKKEMKTSLKPGTKYFVQFSATYGGSTFKSGKYGFTTAKKAPRGSVKQFLSDRRWANGTSWGYEQRPKISSYSSKGCCAYCADFAKYVYGKNSPRSGAAFTSTKYIRANDILQIKGHWLVVLARSGNTLKVAEGNVKMSGGNKVHVSTGTWTIKGNSLKNKYESGARALVTGYHFQ